MHDKVLIISDNPQLCIAFQSIIAKKRLNDVAFTFATSPFSDVSHFNLGPIPIEALDLRDSDTIAKIKSSFSLVFSIHCKQIFPAELVQSVKCINIHPGYNPINRGWYPQVFAIINKVPVGATIHEIDEKLDHGKIIARAFVQQDRFDTSETLYNKITAMEIALLDDHLEAILHDQYATINPEDEGNLYLKKDFNALLQLDLNEKMTIGDCIDRLRALTHGAYDNAYFIDPKSGQKVYVGIRLKPETDGKG